MKRKKNLIFLLIFFISIGFAATATQLYITGSTLFTGNTWNVHFENANPRNYGESYEGYLRDIDVGLYNDEELDFRFDYSKPGDYGEFSVDIVNDGSLNALINDYGFYMRRYDENLGQDANFDVPEFINYSIRYTNGFPMLTGFMIPAHSSATIVIRIELDENVDPYYLDDSSEYNNYINFEVDFDFTIAPRDSVAYDASARFVTGSSFNNHVYEFASISDIYMIKRSYELPPKYKDADHVVSDEYYEDSYSNVHKIYTWFVYDDKTLYYYSDAPIIYFAEDASDMFSEFTNLLSIDLDTTSIKYSQDINNMFYNCNSLIELDLSTWDTSNLWDYPYLIDSNQEETSLTTVYVGNNYKNNFNNDTFRNCINIVGGKGTIYNEDNSYDYDPYSIPDGYMYEDYYHDYENDTHGRWEKNDEYHGYLTYKG